MPNLNTYLLLDTSGSMKGEPAQCLESMLKNNISLWRQDSSLLEMQQVAIVTFDREVKEIVPLTPLSQQLCIHFTTAEFGPTILENAVKYIVGILQDNDYRKNFTSIFIFIDGKRLNSELQKQLQRLHSLDYIELYIIGIGALVSQDYLDFLAGNNGQTCLIDTCDELKKFIIKHTSDYVEADASDGSSNKSYKFKLIH